MKKKIKFSLEKRSTETHFNTSSAEKLSIA